jgi:CubicO group peptidase (beta-lactamase class C family)
MMRDRIKVGTCAVSVLSVVLLWERAAAGSLPAEDPSLPQKLRGLDAYMQKVVKDWNVPGVGLAIAVKDKVVFAKGYGFRDYGKKIPFTAETTVPIASNTKLFTAVAVGLLVEDGKLDWDKPVRQFVPTIQFYNDELNARLTVRDMLSHRSGITRHDGIWYKSSLTRKELFERLRYLEPAQPIRQAFLYNNMMYAGAGYVVELLGAKTWEDFVRERILSPLGMTATVFSIDDMVKQPDHGVPFTERRDSFELHEIPYYREAAGIGPAGSINSNLQDMTKWLLALMNDGMVGGKTVIPGSVLKATLAPAIALPNTQLEARGWGEVLNPVYGMGRRTASYRGHQIAYHGGDINGFHSQVSLMPQDGLGAIVLVIGDHAASLYNIISYNAYERVLGMSLTPWSERGLDIRLRGKAAGKEARARAGSEQVSGTKPSHLLDDYVGEFEHPAYGVLTISKGTENLNFEFHKIRLPLTHFHYDRFDTPNDEEEGKWSVNFSTSPQGEVDKALVSLDEAEVSFVRRVPSELSAVATLRPYAGTYESPTGAKVEVVLKANGSLGFVLPGQPLQALIPWKPHRFRVKEFSDVVTEFVLLDGQVTEMKRTDPSGEYRYRRK